MPEGISSNLRCWFWFCCSSHQKNGVLIKKEGTWLLETFLFLRVVSFGKEVRIKGQDEQVLSYL